MSADFRWLLKKFFSLIDISFQPPKQKISDPDELQEYKLRKRKVWFIVIVDKMKIIYLQCGEEMNMKGPPSYKHYWTSSWNKTWKKSGLYGI